MAANLPIDAAEALASISGIEMQEQAKAACKMQERIAALGTDMLKEMARKLFVDNRFDAVFGGGVMMAVLDELETRMPETEFVAFLDDVPDCPDA